MIEIKDPLLKKEIKDGIADQNEVVRYLLKNYSSWDIVTALSEMIMADIQLPTKITITAEELFAHFKIRGYKADGTRENRGNKSEGSEEYEQLFSDLTNKIK